MYPTDFVFCSHATLVQPHIRIRGPELENVKMASTPPSYTKVTHSSTYPAIDPTQPGLSTAGKIVVITGASGGIGRATARSFAASGPRALVLLGRRSDALAETAELVRSSPGGSDVVVETHEVELCDAKAVRAVANKIVDDLGGIDILVHAAGVLAPVVPLLEADPETFLDGYKTTIVGTLAVAQAVVLANKTTGSAADKEVTFLHLTTAGILFPPFPGMGAYVSSKMAALKLMQAFAVENPQVRLHHVHPGFLDTAMSTQLSKSVKLPFAFDDSESAPSQSNQPMSMNLTNTVLLPPSHSLTSIRLPCLAGFSRGELPQWKARVFRLGRGRAQSAPEGDCRRTTWDWRALAGFPGLSAIYCGQPLAGYSVDRGSR